MRPEERRGRVAAHRAAALATDKTPRGIVAAVGLGVSMFYVL